MSDWIAGIAAFIFIVVVNLAPYVFVAWLVSLFLR